MPVMNFDLEDGKPPVTFTLKESDTVRFMAFMAECDRALEGRAAKPAPLPSPENVREIAEEYCDVREECGRGWEWRFNYSGLQNFAVALLSAAPPLPVAQGVPDIGAIWEQAICEVEAGITLAELRPNQIPGLFQILRRNVEAKLAAAPKETT